MILIDAFNLHCPAEEQSRNEMEWDTWPILMETLMSHFLC